MWYLPLIIVGSLIVAYACYVFIYRWFMSKQFPLKNSNCYITGGSQGLGRAVAIELAKRGANVVISARRQVLLEQVVEELKFHQILSAQTFGFVVVDVTEQKAAVEAVQKASQLLKGPLNYVFICAGKSSPDMFLDIDLDVFEGEMKLNYLGSAYTAREAAKQMVANKTKGKIVLASSILGLFGMVGYSSYTPTKFAIRGFAEVIRQELCAYGIQIHAYFPSTLLTPGHEAESLTIPKVTRDFVGTDGLKPEEAAKQLLKGIQYGQFLITSDFIGTLAASLNSGLVPGDFLILDLLRVALGWMIFPFFRLYVDGLVKQASKNKERMVEPL